MNNSNIAQNIRTSGKKITLEQLIETLKNLKIVPVIAIKDVHSILPLGEALVKNGLPVAEVTFRSAAAADAIKALRDKQPEILIGAGTVLNRQQVIEAKNAGADFIVSPGFNPNTVEACFEFDLPIIPGANNPTAIEMALELGITVLKFFPAEASGGVKMINALLAPYQQISFMPTGGINAENIHQYLAIPRVIACGGSWMVDPKLIAAENWQEIGRLTQLAVNSVNLNS